MFIDNNIEIYASVIFYFGAKIICVLKHWYVCNSMMHKSGTLTSIPERNEGEEDSEQKWVPKKKHEVLKAKYKCLKKLFQIYDANVVGFFPENNLAYPEPANNRRRKRRSHRTQSDACAGTSDPAVGDVTRHDQSKPSITNTAISANQSLPSVQTKPTNTSKSETTITDSESNDSKIKCDQLEPKTESPCQCRHNECTLNPCEFRVQNPLPYLVLGDRRKLTRFQCFIQRVFGIRRDTRILTNDGILTASDTLANRDRRRRRGLRFRRIRKMKKIKSETDIRDVRSPVILSYVQSVQKYCLMDRTPRQCPITGCSMVSYGIINYNDHLNLCHFNNRRFVCHYCHEGFEQEHDKIIHENEHIGMGRLAAHASTLSTTDQAAKIASITQTDPQKQFSDDKLMKIVSFFEKIADQDGGKSRGSETNVRSTTASETTEDDKRTVSCINICKRVTCGSSDGSDVTSKLRCLTPLTCRLCGENFNYRRQLSLHVDLEHRYHQKYTKFHSCAGLLARPRTDLLSEDGHISICTHHTAHPLHTPPSVTEASTKSEDTLTCDPSTNIVYYSSTESVRKPSIVETFVKKVKSYKWEPQTKIIRV